MPFNVLQPSMEYRRAVGWTNSAGAFSIHYENVGDASVAVVADGYATIASRFLDSSHVVLTMRPESPTARRITLGHDDIDMGTRDTILIDVDTPGVAKDRHDADFAFIVRSWPERKFELLGEFGRSEFRRIEKAIAHGDWETECEAPPDGYAERVALELFHNKFFFRSTKDGVNRFGRLTLDLAVSRPGQWDSGEYRGTIILQTTLNPTGTREVCPEPTRGEDEVLREIEAAQREGEAGDTTRVGEARGASEMLLVRLSVTRLGHAPCARARLPRVSHPAAFSLSTMSRYAAAISASSDGASNGRPGLTFT
jgi:hypothetical protein